jgi:hypothetical protein
MKKSRKGRSAHVATPLRSQVSALEVAARRAGVATTEPDVPRLRTIVADLGRLHRRLARTGGDLGLQRHIAALHVLITEVCDAHIPPAPPRVLEPPRITTISLASPIGAHEERRPVHRRYPEESGDSVRTVGGGLPGLGRRR